VVTSARVGYRKPHPAIYRQALLDAGETAETTAMVGDNLNADVIGAEAAGLHGVFLNRTGRTGIPASVYQVKSLLDVPLSWPPEGQA
jgi:putative hydrolase of the HAD superfamily